MATDPSVLIDAALARIDSQISKVSTDTDAAMTAAEGFASINTPDRLGTYGDFAVPPFVPNADLSQDFAAAFGKEWDTLDTWLQNLLTGWGATFFPKLDACIQPSSDLWMCNVVNEGYIGIPAAVENQIWERSRSKELLEANRMEQEAVDQAAIRGFSMPPGATLGRMLQVQADASDQNAIHAREISIKQVEISIEMTKLAITEMNKLRLGVAHAMADMVRAFMQLPLAAAEIAKSQATFKHIMWQATGDYIRALVAKNELQLRADITQLEMDVSVAEKNGDLFMRKIANIVNAAIAAAEQAGRIAASAQNAQVTLVGDVTNTQIAS